MNFSNKNTLIINGTAGHGKDYVLDSLPDIIQRDVIPVSFSKVIKTIVAKNLPEHIKEIFIDKDEMETLNILKDERHDINVYGDMNMRKFLQVFLGNEVLRKINPNINMLLTAQSMKNDIENNDDFIFVCSDNRYANEQEFLLKFNQVSENEKIEFLNDFIYNHKTKYNDFEIIEVIENGLKSQTHSEEDQNYMSKLIIDFIKLHKPLSNVKKPKQDYSDILNNFDFESIGKMSQKEGTDIGIINIFRPILPQGFNTNSSKQEIKQSIMDFTNLSLIEVNKIEESYNKFNIDFNVEKIQKYSFLRADPNHISERQLDGRKPAAFLNNPKDSELISIQEQIRNTLNNTKKQMNNKAKISL